MIVALILILIFGALIYIGIKENKKQIRYKTGAMTEEEKAKYERQQEAREQFRSLAEQKQSKRKIKQTSILNTVNDSRKKVGSSVIRGTVVGTVAGAVNPVAGLAGIAGGAMSGKNKTNSTTTFLIEYEDGHRETKTVKNNSAEYNKLAKYIKM